MAKLCLTFDGSIVKEYPLDEGVSLTIGRLKNNDIVIKDPTVSRLHAKIEYLEGRFLLANMQSKNGVLVNEAPVASHWLGNGDILTIGRHHLIFAGDDDELVLQGEGKRDAAELADLLESGSELIPAADPDPSPQKLARRTRAGNTGVLSFLDGGEGEVKLAQSLISVGKDPACDLVLGGALVGKISFTIERRANGYYLNYVGGVSVPRVSGQPVRHSMKLEESDVIEVGPAIMRFSGGSGIPRGSTGRRRAYRRKTDLPGAYHTPNGDMYWMVVVSLSKGGLRMQTFQSSDIKRGDILKIEFTLDDEKQSRISIDAVIRYISNEFIGCKFLSLNRRAGKALRSYLMP